AAARQHRDGIVHAAHHHAQVEAGAEPLGPAGEDHRRRFALGAVQRVDHGVDHLVRQRVGLAVVHADDGDVVFEAVFDHGVAITRLWTGVSAGFKESHASTGEPLWPVVTAMKTPSSKGPDARSFMFHAPGAMRVATSTSLARPS